MLTRSGTAFHLLDPRPDEVHISDIAWALAHLNRYVGHTLRPWSVAQHCIATYLVLAAAGERFALDGLMHDAAEAYTGDVSRPMKVALRAAGGNSALADIEAGIDDAIAARFGLARPRPAGVKVADLTLTHAERHALMPGGGPDWGFSDTLYPVPSVVQRMLVAPAPEPAQVALAFEATFLAARK